MKDAIKNSIRTTKFATAAENAGNWYIVDLKDKILGRAASEIAKRIEENTIRNSHLIQIQVTGLSLSTLKK